MYVILRCNGNSQKLTSRANKYIWSCRCFEISVYISLSLSPCLSFTHTPRSWFINPLYRWFLTFFVPRSFFGDLWFKTDWVFKVKQNGEVSIWIQSDNMNSTLKAHNMPANMDRSKDAKNRNDWSDGLFDCCCWCCFWCCCCNCLSSAWFFSLEIFSLVAAICFQEKLHEAFDGWHYIGTVDEDSQLWVWISLY